ncbi:MAG: uroporphyrinogen decarboxylase family protein [Cellulosilyticaceae bacterium]
MNSKERVLRTLEFRSPDCIPQDLWILPAARERYGEQLEVICCKYETDIVSISGPFDHANTPKIYQKGTFVDEWGSEWLNIQPGLIGEVKKPVLEDEDKIEAYQIPLEQFLKEWEQQSNRIDENIASARQKEKFVIGGWISIFERMQYLRGTEELYCDIALEEEPLEKLKQFVSEFYITYVDKWLEKDVDAISFGDDWGSQLSLLISLETWKKHFKPIYKTLFDKIKSKGKKVFFHSDGYIMALYPEFIEMGVDAINSQLWCMGVEEVAKSYAGKITFWGEISRQGTLPNGTAEDVLACAAVMKKHLFVNGGGLIGQSEVNRDVPLTNVEALLNAWQ